MNKTQKDRMQRDHGPFKVVDTRVVFETPWLHVREDSVIRPGGTPGKFGIVTMRHGSSVLPIEEDGTVYLAREFKYAIGRESVEVFSGGFEDGEEPLDAAKRELQEELEMTANEWIAAGCLDPFTTVINSPNYMFIARGLQK